MSDTKTLQVRVLCATLGVGASDLASEIGIERTAINKVLTGTRVNRGVRQKVAKFLGEKVEALILNQPGANEQTAIDHG